MKKELFYSLNLLGHIAKKVTHSIINIQDIKQVVRSSGSVSANYIEANESLSKADFIYRKEAKETRLWLNLIDIEDKKSWNLQNYF